ncbi:hypothetical protein NLU13_0048 [Sarocladium strictum]|uniref:FAD-binding PCMH-type domain-containing protein n=1 Tax=Sarocladium strictum TaxID=5046 RepID=A0AA39LB52_SARSR|nr:hypothetical protein NLU13_0048 [Sarocladium strictum]
MRSSTLLALGAILRPAISTSRNCRATPSTPDWPSLPTWSDLNATLSGRLIKPIPAAGVCYGDRPEFNTSECRKVFAAWHTQEWHAEDPISLHANQFTDWSCLPLNLDAGEENATADATMPLPRSDGEESLFTSELRSEHEPTCSDRGYPAYVVNASTVEHNNIRLSIKNTGHDVCGRANGPGSLSIWTHHLNHVEHHDGSFTLTGSGRKIQGDFITAGSGCQNYKVQELAHEHGRVFTGGGSKTVGLGGFIAGGGHGVLSPHFGLAADNVVQIEVVTPNGEALTANEDTNPDLFWALRGGGGSTFGVVTSFVVRIHQDKPLERVLLFGLSEPNSDTARELVPWGLSKTPYLMDGGVSGYMFSSHSIRSPIAVPGGDEHPIVGGFVCMGMVWDPKEEGAAAKAVQSMVDEAKKRWGEKAHVFLDVQRYGSFLEWFEVHHDQGPVGGSSHVVSRLFDRKTLEDEELLKRIVDPAVAPSWGLGAYMVAGKGVQDAKVPGGSNSVHPAWRDAMVLAMTWKQFPDYDKKSGQEAIRLLDDGWQRIRDEMPHSGSYINEGLVAEKDWQSSFWGANYDKLLAIKRKVDPEDVFWCKPCVGYDRWMEVETEHGRQLCRAW